jgi:hypothetical protein
MRENYLIDLCPACEQPTEYIPNPYYLHECQKCGHQTTQSKLITAVNGDKLVSELSTLQKFVKEKSIYFSRL